MNDKRTIALTEDTAVRIKEKLDGMRSKIVTNKEFDKIGEELDEYLEETFGVTTDASQTCELIQISLNILGMRKQ